MLMGLSFFLVALLGHKGGLRQTSLATLLSCDSVNSLKVYCFEPPSCQPALGALFTYGESPDCFVTDKLTMLCAKTGKKLGKLFPKTMFCEYFLPGVGLRLTGLQTCLQMLFT